MVLPIKSAILGQSHLGITEMRSDAPTCERVLLSPKQVEALRAWLEKPHSLGEKG